VRELPHTLWAYGYRYIRASTAPKSSTAQPGTKVRLPSGHSYITEGPDDEDTFPPMIASYEIVDGWLVYHGKNGSEGVLAGTETALTTWMAQVDRQRASEGTRPAATEWTPAYGGTRNVTLAKAAIQRAGRALGVTATVRFVVNPDARQTGDHVIGHVTIFNPQTDQGMVKGLGPLAGITVPAFAHVAAHEVAHLLFTHKAAAGRQALQQLQGFTKQHGGAVTLYHALAGDFEGLMDVAAFYVNVGAQLRQRAPELYQLVDEWVHDAN